MALNKNSAKTTEETLTVTTATPVVDTTKSLEDVISDDLKNFKAGSKEGVSINPDVFTTAITGTGPAVNTVTTTPVQNTINPTVNVGVQAMTQQNNSLGLGLNNSQARTFGGVWGGYTSWLSGGADAEVTRLIELADKCIIKHDSGNLKGNYKLHAVSREKQTGTFSAFVLSIHQVIGGKEIVAFHPFLIESSRSPLDPYLYDTTAGKIEIVIPTAEAYTDSFKDHVVKQIRQDYKNANLTTVECGMQVIPREAEIKTEDDLLIFLGAGVNSCALFIESMNPNAIRFNLKQITDDNNIRVMARTYLDTQNYTAANLPVRSDIVIEMSATSQGNSGKQGITEQRSMLLTRASAYVDLVYTPPPATFGQNMFQPGHPYYVPRICITQLETDLAGSSLEFILLGIANMTILGRNKTYGISWKNNKANKAGINLRDFGAVGLQVPGLLPDNQPAIINVTESDQALRQLMDTVLNPNTVYTLEVEQSSPNSWLLSIFADASKEETLGYDARRRIINAADNLTNGNFSPIYAQITNAPVGTDLARVPMLRNTQDQNYVGYYTEGGEKRDIRELDLLAILNILGTKDPTLVNEYIRTIQGTEDIMVRLDKRARILRTFANGVHLRGYSTKYDFMATFVTALTNAVEATGIKVNNNAVGLRGDQMSYQTTQDWAAVMTSANIGNTMFANQGLYNGVNTGFHFNPFAHTSAFYNG